MSAPIGRPKNEPGSRTLPPAVRAAAQLVGAHSIACASCTETLLHAATRLRPRAAALALGRELAPVPPTERPSIRRHEPSAGHCDSGELEAGTSCVCAFAISQVYAPCASQRHVVDAMAAVAFNLQARGRRCAVSFESLSRTSSPRIATLGWPGRLAIKQRNKHSDILASFQSSATFFEAP